MMEGSHSNALTNKALKKGLVPMDLMAQNGEGPDGTRLKLLQTRFLGIVNAITENQVKFDGIIHAKSFGSQ